MVRDPPDSTQPCGIYLHFPFCEVRCTYCDFATVAGQDGAIGAYLEALEAEILGFQRELEPQVDSVYLGGGTPSRMTVAQVGRLLSAVHARFEVLEPCEITLECNPESIGLEALAGYRDAGVNRISIGVQSLDDRVLRRVGRAHDSAAALRAIESALGTAGLEVSVDLIAGLPGEALGTWAQTVGRIAGLGPDHVSVYLLELDKDTPLARSVRAGRTRVSDDEALVAAYVETVSVLEAHGLRLYEASNFARGGRVSRHNTKYWSDAWYGGFGLGAHAYLRGMRRANRRDLPGYVAELRAGRDPLAWSDPWDARRRLEEALFLGLRLAEGLDLSRLGQRYDVDLLADYREAWERGAAAGLLEWAGTRVRLTERGRLLSNELFVELIGA